MERGSLGSVCGTCWWTVECEDCTCWVLSGGEGFLGDVSRSFGAVLHFSDLFKGAPFCASRSTGLREGISTSPSHRGGEGEGVKEPRRGTCG